MPTSNMLRGTFLIAGLLALTTLAASALRAEDSDPEKARKKEAERAAKEREKAEKEARKQAEKREKEARKRQEEAAKAGKDAKAPLVPPAPTVTEKSGDPIRDYVADFETAYAGSAALFEVDPLTKHDYGACGGKAMALCKAAHGVAKMHDERVRQYGNDYHHQLEELAQTAKKLSEAVRAHRREDIFSAWTQLKTERDTLALTPAWRAE
ncbi:MAG: hypothetical protein KIS92_11235 [Planctomycetota bacterium]|nr:hypothetical protein [Planctomycetota bacterium]